MKNLKLKKLAKKLCKLGAKCSKKAEAVKSIDVDSALYKVAHECSEASTKIEYYLHNSKRKRNPKRKKS